jgi:hypothetical protein
MSQISYHRRHFNHSSFRTYGLVFVACFLISLVMQALVGFDDEIKGGLEKATEDVIKQLVKSELEKELGQVSP